MLNNFADHSGSTAGDLVLENEELKKRISKLEEEAEVYRQTIAALGKRNEELLKKHRAAYNELTTQLEEVKALRNELKDSIQDVVLMKANFHKQFNEIIGEAKRDEKWIGKHSSTKEA